MGSFGKALKKYLDNLYSHLGRNRRSVRPRTRVSSSAILVHQMLFVWRKATTDGYRLIQKDSGNRQHV
jgi:hypothetical protein